MKLILPMTSFLLVALLIPLPGIFTMSEGDIMASRSDDNDMGNATMIALNTSAVDTLHNDTDFVDWYEMDTGIGDIIIVNLTVPDTGDFDLSVWNVNGEPIQFSSNLEKGGFEEVTFMANTSDRYYIQILAFSGNGSYTLYVKKDSEYVPDGNDYIYTATEITPPATIQDDLVQGLDDNDYFKLELGKNDELHATLSYQPSRNFDLYFMNPDGELLNESTDFTGYEEIYHTCKKAGTYYVLASVVWGTGDYVLSVSVIRANAAPEIVDLWPDSDNVTMDEDTSLVFWISASDPEYDVLEYTWKVDEAVIMVGNDRNELNITASYNDTYSAGSYVISVTVRDSYNSATMSWNLTVVDVNPLPEITVKWPEGHEITIHENENVYFNLDVIDPDGTVPLLQWYMNDTPVRGETRELYNFRANYDMAGTYDIRIEVTDGIDPHLNISRSWRVRVLNIDRNPIPTDIFPSIYGQTDEETPLTFTFIVNDQDGDVPSYTWYLDGVRLESENGENYTFVPSYDSHDGKTHAIRVVVLAGEKELNHTWELMITNVNRPPRIDNSTLMPKSLSRYNEGDEIRFSVDVDDPDHDNISYSWIVMETGEEISTLANFTYDLDEGHYTILLNVRDEYGYEDSSEFGIDVVAGKKDSPGFGVSLLLGIIFFLAFILHFNYRKQ